MRVFSKSQGKFIDTPDAGATSSVQTQQPSTTSSLGGGVDLKKILTIAGLSDLKNITKYSGAVDLLDKLNPPPTDEEKKATQSKTDADRIVTQLENAYFNDKLHYGGIKGIIADTVLPTIDPNDPYVVWKQMLESDRPFLAKAAGDTGNIAYAEQLQAGKPFPTARSDRTTAVKRFTEIRNKLGLQARNYKDLTGYAPSGLNDLGGQYGL